jgi:hypothetical protein
LLLENIKALTSLCSKKRTQSEDQGLKPAVLTGYCIWQGYQDSNLE